MKIKNILDNVLYAGLLLCALLFIKQPFENFLNRITDHSFTHAPITLNDLPTVTVCFMQPFWFRGQDDRYHHRSANNLKIGKHLQIDVKIFEQNTTKTVTLVENKGVSTLFGIELYLKRLHVDPSKRWANTTVCYMIVASPLKDNEEIDFRLFGMELSFNFLETSDVFLLEKEERTEILGLVPLYKTRGAVTFTSTQNSYGCTGHGWFDGNADVISLTRFKSFDQEFFDQSCNYNDLDSDHL